MNNCLALQFLYDWQCLATGAMFRIIFSGGDKGGGVSIISSLSWMLVTTFNRNHPHTVYLLHHTTYNKQTSRDKLFRTRQTILRIQKLSPLQIWEVSKTMMEGGICNLLFPLNYQLFCLLYSLLNWIFQYPFILQQVSLRILILQ